ncbi:NACHT domain- and WD repeat-containing protein 1 [Synchiropus splendidus]|uniref:NACHT domain- and WD repeat-containing protein 1 n=1 Tax=Synchiropus splendidus TaxID=270530 RepID=UPI00237E9536|nr:NACHT domain- and WD repeat-containing protein 1 [Synchiropus splendidus]
MEGTCASEKITGRSLQDFLRGQRIQTTGSNMIRVFISSTFTDMSSERKVLLERAFPQVQAFCRSLGLLFEAVDLRWGLRSITPGDHEACEVFIEEIERCRRLSAGPSFVALLGNRYGHRALPLVIPEKLLEVLLATLSKSPDGVKHLTQWFWKDENAIPPVYVLQPISTHFSHYSDLRPESAMHREQDVTLWRLAETQLLKLLRSAASDAEAAGDITVEQKQVFFTSVLEREFDLGLSNKDGKPPALLFVREIPKQRVRDGPKRLAKFMDVTLDGLLDMEAQGLLANLKSRLYTDSKNILNLHCVELNKGSIDPKRKEHVQYLDSFCEDFVSQMKSRIEAGFGRAEGPRWGNMEENGEGVADRLVEEVGWHMSLCSELCRGLHGREGLLGKLCLAMWESTNSRHSPLVVHGGAGMGKSALLCKLAQEMQTVLEAKTIVVIRLLSIGDPQRPDVDVLLRSICSQICLTCGLVPPSCRTANTHLDLVGFFHDTLEQVSQRGQSLLIILDSIDLLSEHHHGHKLHWMPNSVPPNIHLVVSMDTNSEVFVNVRLKLKTLDGFFEVERLSRDEGNLITDSYLRAYRRTLTSEQREAVLQRFDATGSPLHLTLMLFVAKRWASTTPIKDLHLGANVQEMVSQFFVMMEEKHGRELVGGALGYIALSRDGLLEAELRDILSLDNDILSEVYKYSLPPTPSLIRFPPLILACMRKDLDDLLEERWRCGVAALTLKSRRVREAVCARYLTSERRGKSLSTLAEYFQGRWSGKLKPVSLPGLSLLLSDRKVPPQPLWFAPGLVNVRKLQELPHHLLHAGLWEELRQDVISSAEWLYCKSKLCGVASVIHDLDHSSRYMDCAETGLIRDTLLLIKPSLDYLDGHMDMVFFFSELLARLSSLATPFPSMIGRLCSQCEEWLLTCSEPILIPKCSFLPAAGGALQHTMNGPHTGVLCLDLSVEAKLLVVGSEDGLIAVWSLADRFLIQVLRGHTAAVLCLKLTDGATNCLSLSADGSLRRWSLNDGQQLLCIQEAVSVDPVPTWVHLHHLGQLLCVHTRTEAKILQLDSGLVLNHLEGSEVLGVLNDSVFVLSNYGRVTITNLNNKTLDVHLENCHGSVTPAASVTLPRRGKVFVVSKEGVLYQISSRGRHTTSEFPLIPSLLSVSQEEKILLAGSDQTLSLFNINSDSVDKFLNLQHDDVVLSAQVTADCRQLVSGAADQLIRIWSVTTGALLDCLCGSNVPVTSLFLYDGFILSASSSDSCVHMWALRYDPLHRPTPHIPAGCAFATVTRDADQIFYIRESSQREVVSWDNRLGSVVDYLALSAEVCCMELAQHKRLLMCGLTTGTVLIYPLDLPQETLCIPPPENFSRVLCLAVSSQEKYLAVAHEDAVCLFEITTRDNFPTVDGPMDRFSLPLLLSPLSSMALLNDRRLLYGTQGGEVMVYDFSCRISSTLDPHSSRVTCVTVSNWGTHALVGSEDAVQRLWALNPLVLDHTMEYNGFFFEGVLCTAFSESDQFVFTGSQDRTVKVWSVSTGNLLRVQYVYSPVVRMVTYRNGFVALSQHGAVIKEVFRCPDPLSPDYNPLKKVKARYRVISRQKNPSELKSSTSDVQDYNPAQFDLNVISMLKVQPSSTCVLL